MGGASPPTFRKTMDAEMAQKIAEIIAQKAKVNNSSQNDDYKHARRSAMKRLRATLNAEDYDTAAEVLEDLWDIRYEQMLATKE